jgi:hypothetical protein
VWCPIGFRVRFGPSSDYEVFLPSRVKQCYDQCGEVTRGRDRAASSERIITSAAVLVMITVLVLAVGDQGADRGRAGRRRPGL